MDLKQFIADSTPVFDDPAAVRREAFQACAALLSAGDQSTANLDRLAAYLGWTRAEVAALAEKGRGFRATAPPTLRALAAAGHTKQVEAYALFLVQVTRLACVQFAPGDAGAARAASAIAATVTRTAPISNTRLEPVTATEPPAPAQPSESGGAQAVGEALDDLERLVGLEDAKREINQQVQLIRIAQMREKAGLRNPTVSRHLVFVGNPGTGKTTVARIVGRIYSALGVVRDGHLLEVDASGLVAGYVGQTAIKVTEVFDRADEGVLLIDEAYTLARGGERDFGREAIDMIVKLIEDRRDRIVVIAAGYPDEMAEFIDANPGLRSRFPKVIEFPDYDTDELTLIFERMGDKNRYHADDEALRAVRAFFDAQPRDKGFGNARLARNLFEAAVANHASRIVALDAPTPEQLSTLVAADVPSTLDR